ncbi:hypothetical protein [Siminovitchia fortis]|uniref:hypothetical protein n=1 Tax=Siminovitchia fortis TaxID=254758 RepID=UPI00119F0B39|nr:hypothetical protein [Siminovitchia fortis]
MLKIHCPKCREVFQETDVVLLDFINTITHASCYTGSYELIHDKGTFKEFVEKYPFLQEFVH